MNLRSRHGRKPNLRCSYTALSISGNQLNCSEFPWTLHSHPIPSLLRSYFMLYVLALNVHTYCMYYHLALKNSTQLCSILSKLSLLYTGNGLTQRLLVLGTQLNDSGGSPIEGAGAPPSRRPAISSFLNIFIYFLLNNLLILRINLF